MVHLVYCDDKEKVLEKILEGSKTMIIRAAAGRKIPHSRVFEGEILMERVFKDYPNQSIYVMSDVDPYYEKLGYRREGSIFEVKAK